MFLFFAFFSTGNETDDSAFFKLWSQSKKKKWGNKKKSSYVTFHSILLCVAKGSLEKNS
jgi:hypothetical protein